MSEGPDSARPAAAVEPPEPTSTPRVCNPWVFWQRELLRMALFAGAGAVIGGVFDNWALGMAAGFALCLIIQARHLIALRLWLQRPKGLDLPEPGGTWGEVFDGLVELQRKHRKKKKRLTAMLAEFQASTAALPDGAVVLGERGEISWFNAAARTLLALRTPQDIGIRIVNLVRHPLFTGYFTRAQFEHEVELPSPVNATRTLALRVIPYGNKQKLLIVRDVSERLQLESARRDFVANASHELRTPLTVLRGYLDMMEIDAQGDTGLGPWKTPVREMRNQVLRMETLVSDMLKLARLESGRAQMREEVLDVPALLNRAADEAKAVSAGQHRFEVEIDSALTLKGGESEVQSLATNLLTNAVRYTPAGGVIRLSWHAGEEGGAQLAIADSGIGIAQADIPRLTERFYRVDIGRSRASGGTGLGLSIVKHALEAFDARLEIESELGVGSTFTCRFPAHRVQPMRARVGGGAQA